MVRGGDGALCYGNHWPLIDYGLEVRNLGWPEVSTLSVVLASGGSGFHQIVQEKLAN